MNKETISLTDINISSDFGYINSVPFETRINLFIEECGLNDDYPYYWNNILSCLKYGGCEKQFKLVNQ